MPAKGKLSALIKSLQIEERDLLLEVGKIQEVVNTRAELLQQIKIKHSEIMQKIDELNTSKRLAALKSGDGHQLSSIAQFKKRLMNEVEQIKDTKSERTRELNSAAERLDIAQQDLIAVRIEIKRVEKLIDRRARSKQAHDVASEEASADELNFYRTKK